MSKLNEKPNGGKVYLRYLHNLCGIYHNPWPSYIIDAEDDGGFTCGSTVMIILLTYHKKAQPLNFICSFLFLKVLSCQRQATIKRKRAILHSLLQ